MLPKRNIKEELKVKSETGNDTKKLRERSFDCGQISKTRDILFQLKFKASLIVVQFYLTI